MRKILLLAALVAGCALQRNAGEERLPAAVRMAAENVWVAATPTGGHGTAFPVAAAMTEKGRWRVVFLTAKHVADHSPLTLRSHGGSSAQVVKVLAVYRHPLALDEAALVAVMDDPPLLVRVTDEYPLFGDPVWMAGFPMMRVRRITAGTHSDTLCQVACDGAFGNSGGPMLDSQGRAFGILVGGAAVPPGIMVWHVSQYEPIDLAWLHKIANPPPVVRVG